MKMKISSNEWVSPARFRRARTSSDVVHRRRFLQQTVGFTAALASLGCDPRSAAKSESEATTSTSPHLTKGSQRVKEGAMSHRQPVLFVGHGSPMNALGGTPWSDGWRALGKTLFAEHPPKAILAISAHWETEGTQLTAQQQPRTIHDFGGFPRPLFEMQYAAPGAPALARQVAALVASPPASLDDSWGLDHGTWSVLTHLRPQADIPVVQLSLNTQASAAEHIRIGEQLRTLRDEGVLIFATGNITHNLRHAMQVIRGGAAPLTPTWAADFDARTAEAAHKRDLTALTRALDDDVGRISHPSPEHWLPMLYAVAASEPGEAVTFPVEGFDAGSLSMRSVVFGI